MIEAELKELCRQMINEKDSEKRIKIRNKIVVGVKPIILSTIKPLRHITRATLNDLLQYGYLGVIKSLDNMELSTLKKVKCSTYIFNAAKWEIIRDTKMNEHMIKLPEHIYYSSSGEYFYKFEDIDEYIESEDEILAFNEEAYEEVEFSTLKEILEELKKRRLSERQIQVLDMRFKNDLIFEDISKELGCSRMNVFRIEKDALRTLRYYAYRTEKGRQLLNYIKS